MRKAFHAICSQPWAITQDALRTMLLIATRELRDLDAVEAQKAARLRDTSLATTRNGVAIIPVAGPIFRYANLFSDMSGATSVAVLGRDFTTALNDPAIRAILLTIDSPGGEVNGINEFTNMIYAARGKKPITAYVGGTGASAAYWIASAADEIVADETAILGSIGVIAAIPTDDAAGEVVFVSSQSPRKRPDPTSEGGAADIQAVLDATAQVFIETVARNRKVSAEQVLNGYGQGGVFVGRAAVEAGLADRLSSFEAVLAGLAPRSQQVAYIPPPAQPAAPATALAAPAAIPHISAGLGSLVLSDLAPAALYSPRGDIPTLSHKESRMSEPQDRPPTPAPTAPVTAPAPVAPPLPPPPAVQDAAMQSRLDAYVAQMEARNQAVQEAAFQRAQAEFERRIQELDQRRAIEQFARARTITSIGQPWALPCQAEELTALLAETPAAARTKWMTLLSRITTSGLVSFDEIGSSAEGAELADQWAALVNAKVGAGRTRVQAIQEASREHPDLYAAQTRAKKGGR